MMDDVFGNCSGDTVMEADLSRVLANLHQDLADLQYLQQQAMAPRMARTETGGNQILKPVPQPRFQPSSLRHTQSEVVSIHRAQNPRPRALSTGASTHDCTQTHNFIPHPQPNTNHGYVNLQEFAHTQKLSGRPTSPYDNLSEMSCQSSHPVYPQLSVDMAGNSKAQSIPLSQASHSHSLLVREESVQNFKSGSVFHSTTSHSHSVLMSIDSERNFKTQSIPVSQSMQSIPVSQPVQSIPGAHSTTQSMPVYQSMQSIPVSHSTTQSIPVYQSVPSVTVSQSSNSQCQIKGDSVHNLKAHSSAPPPPSVISASPQNKIHVGYPVPPPSTPTLPPPAPQQSPIHRYMNVPLVERRPITTGGGSSSAPSTPQHGAAPHRLHHSYIELWSGIREERDSLSDSECEELKRSFKEPAPPSTRPSHGYVEMSSPYIKKSPQVTSPFTGSVLADFASRLASYAGHQPRNIFCPLCPRYFGYEKSLGSHIHKAHRTELNKMVESECRELKLQLCPICQAQFFNTSVLPKHLLDFHRASIIEILDKNNGIVSDALGIQCPFCSKKVPHGTTGEQVLVYHIQQLHLGEYEELIKAKIKPVSRASLDSLCSLGGSETAIFQPGVTSTPGLSNQLAGLGVGYGRSVEALNLDTTWSSHTGKITSPKYSNLIQHSEKTQHSQQEHSDKQLSSHVSKGILRHQSGIARKPSVKRELRFSVPPVTSEEVFIPESPEQATPERCQVQQQQQQQVQQNHQQQQSKEANGNKRIAVRVDSLSAADFMDLTDKRHRKRRRLGIGLKSRKAFKKKDKENFEELPGGIGKIVDGAKKCITESQKTKEPVVSTSATRTFRKPKPVAIPSVPQLPAAQACNSEVVMGAAAEVPEESPQNMDTGSEISPFTNLKLYSPLRMFRCNSCRVKFCDNESLASHINGRHRGLLCLLRPQYGCGVCSAKFFENKYLVKHCLQHHTSLLEIRSPRKQKTAIFRFT